MLQWQPLDEPAETAMSSHPTLSAAGTMVKKNVADLKPEELAGKVVFVRADLNVPQVRAAATLQHRSGAPSLVLCLPANLESCVAGQDHSGHHR
jgi:hypothetical protein